MSVQIWVIIGVIVLLSWPIVRLIVTDLFGLKRNKFYGNQLMKEKKERNKTTSQMEAESSLEATRSRNTNFPG
ncbi:hypothetical protein [Thalassobacillus pellis]|uniref:hypothetical protein n=1 Tax=Thalassobacillus pellis TaxID=748008 RepID=UPI0019617846|nr:hypothetical protein [Thalassobacillus pellis]MBM7553461.1 hypothetical protein [Thalassobacillus pellis]